MHKLGSTELTKRVRDRDADCVEMIHQQQSDTHTHERATLGRAFETKDVASSIYPGSGL